MIYLEHRRHAKRDKPFPHLNSKGVETARSLGETMGPFDLVVTSKLPRAAETATAMGYGIDAESELLHLQPEDIDLEADWGSGFTPLAASLGKSDKLDAFARKLKAETMDFIKKAGNHSRVLFVSHGGIIELALLCLLDDPHTLDFTDPIKKCEGWSAQIKDGKAFSARDLRLR